MPSFFTGFELAARLNAETRRRVAALARPPRCVALLDAANAGMAAYARRQQAFAGEAGIVLAPEPYPANPEAVMRRLAELAGDEEVDAVVTLYPLPAGVGALEAALALGAGKDVDGLHPENAGALALGAPARPPATAKACRLIAEELAGPLKGKEIVLVGASRIVGRPLASLLLDAEATVTITHAATRDLAAHTREADIVITAAGVPGLIGAGHLRDGATVLDVSINRGPHGLVGDVDVASLEGRSVTVTHVPDGVGPVTTACLLANIAEAAAGRAL
ncbi:bifunctional 5,10-methylenetetrahydrofolate dehydrogenase/5,10-methenyltetrahydrofolate cyclohydrolase [Rhizobiaceae bacterium BDR2-2]|uniref:Bifunctional protein FolD n=1 Tax=Ectorhizobium quercum TaxID=2965071 RepID=A0AAE3N0K6_9HYPH|nr:bifunctional 5,10-methylenetetrahydrofolate dehydrogenase/5,10-methenyltetrahydrofolate cyclohydrolase [Ectorhizobium quercum]MCX8998389.1 bifunctional 5,10-methylenetetrahydrofolate dehydrogenase/5,10-methenyltetrahydrofolate cyclohydrolase [Ectorhizobium quercum]